MSENRNVYLIESLLNSFGDISLILNAMGNQKRFNILINLLNDPVSFKNLMKNSGLQRTALSNQLSKLLKAGLIEKERYGIYKITDIGLKFVKAINKIYYESKTLSRLKLKQKGRISNGFFNINLKK
ncbi:MAG: winged helix-turn-helix transcriptional regulator [archaeon]|nr:winged helix-turn-helix transcriptional regulator [archaeon]